MKILVKDAHDATIKCGALALPLTKGQRPSEEIDSAMGGLPGKTISSGEFSGNVGEVLVIHTNGLIGPERIALVGLGSSDKAGHEAMRKAGGATAKALGKLSIKSMALSTSALTQGEFSPADFVEGAILGSYEFTRYKKAEGKQVASLTIVTKPTGRLSRDIKLASVSAESTNLARDLVNTPAREMTPSAMLRAVRRIKGLTVKVLEKKDALKLGMNAYLSVAGGSHEPPRFIIATYKGAGAGEKPTVLVGKSVTFDSGGLSLKPSGSMETMKYDMAGGAAVLGAMRAAVELKLKVNIIAILPATENLPGGTSPNKPGDVVRAINGTTIEILNTDAEGRLALADSIGYADKMLKPARIIDLATLTGACSVALGNDAMALMGNDHKLMDEVHEAGEAVYERAWQMPLYEEYNDYIKSDIADLRNISRGRTGGLVSSGAFLRGFAGKTPWAHLDIASTAWTDKPGPYTTKGATGIGVRLLIRYLCSIK